MTPPDVRARLAEALSDDVLDRAYVTYAHALNAPTSKTWAECKAKAAADMRGGLLDALAPLVEAAPFRMHEFPTSTDRPSECIHCGVSWGVHLSVPCDTSMPDGAWARERAAESAPVPGCARCGGVGYFGGPGTGTASAPCPACAQPAAPVVEAETPPSRTMLSMIDGNMVEHEMVLAEPACPLCGTAPAAEPATQAAAPAPPMDDLMLEAWTLTNGDRHQAYGPAEQVFRSYGLIWSGLLAHKLKDGAQIDAADVALLMTALKLARDAYQGKRDNIVDAHGFLSLLARIRGWIVP